MTLACTNCGTTAEGSRHGYRCLCEKCYQAEWDRRRWAERVKHPSTRPLRIRAVPDLEEE